MTAARKPHVVVFSSLFPSPRQPQAGVFIRERMFRVAEKLPVTVVSPVAWFPFQSLLRLRWPHFRPDAPRREIQAGIEVLRPRFLSVPRFLKGLDGLFLALASFPTLLALKRAGRLDILDAHFGYPDGYAAGLLGRWLGVPVTVTLRGTEPRHAASPRLRGRLRAALERASRIFAVAASLKRTAASLGIAEDKIRVIGNGVDAGKFQPLPQAEARAKLGLPEGAPVLVSVGGLVERKGFHRVIECLPWLRRRFPGLQYVVVGGAGVEGDFTARLRALVTELGLEDCVRFLGSLPPEELKVPLSAADVFVLATSNEGWANVFLEAMACGLPVVTTDVGGNAEVVCRPELGTVVPFGDPAALSRALESALARAWDREAIIAYARANSWEGRIEALIEEYERLARPTPVAKPPREQGPYTRFVSGVVFPLQERLKNHTTVEARRSLEASQWWDETRLRALQLARLQALLRHAGDRVPYYRELFRKEGFDPAKVHALEDLARLPFLTKAGIRSHLESLKADGARGLARSGTGGSSGEPLIFFLDRERVSHDVAAKWRATRWWGVDIGDPEIVVWGSPIELGAQDRMRHLRDALMRTELLPAFEMSEAKLDEFLRRIRARRPRMLFGYPSALAHIARHARRRGVAMDDLGVTVAFATGERLYEPQRLDIERAFGCRVANGYGSREAGFIAHQCPSGGMHITAEDVIVEVVDPQGLPLGPGRPGEIVVTHLASRQFPFIRYRTGDVGVLSARRCECGRGLPLLEDIQGRTTDFVVARDGTVMHGLALIYVVRDVPGVREFKIVQESLQRTRVLLVTDPDFDDARTQAIRDGIARRIGGQAHVDVQRVSQIPAEASGKYRYVVSHVDIGPRQEAA